MKKLFLILFAAFAVAFTANANAPSNGENLYLDLKEDVLYFAHDGFDGPVYSYQETPAFRKGDQIGRRYGSQALYLRYFLEREGRKNGLIYNNIIVYADSKSTVSIAVELQEALRGLISLEHVVFIIPPKFWHENPMTLEFFTDYSDPMKMEDFLAEQTGETMGVTFTMYEEGQGLRKAHVPDDGTYYHERDIYNLITSLDTGDEYPYLHIKVPQVVTLSNYVAAISALGEAKQDNPFRSNDVYYVPVPGWEGEAVPFFFQYVSLIDIIPTIDKKAPVFPYQCDELGIQSLPVFCFTTREGQNIECRPGSFYYDGGTYGFWAGSQVSPLARIGSYYLDFTVYADGSAKNISPEADFVNNHPQADWDYVIDRVAEEPYWKPSLDKSGKPVNIRLYGVRVFLTF